MQGVHLVDDAKSGVQQALQGQKLMATKGFQAIWGFLIHQLLLEQEHKLWGKRSFEGSL